MRCHNCLLLLFSLAWWAAAVGAQEPPTVDQAFEQLKTYDYGQNDQALHVLELHAVRFASDAPRRAEIAGRLAALVAAPETSLAAKTFACKQLVVVGTEAQVPVLARLLDDPQTAEIARYTLDALPGEAASAALRDACGRLTGMPLVGVINSLGLRRDAAAVPLLAQRLGDSDAQIVAAAAEALGKIGTVEAALALTKAQVPDAARSALHNAKLQCAERLAAAEAAADASALYQEIWASAEPPARRVAALAGLARVAADVAAPLVVESLDAEDPLLRGTAEQLAAGLSRPELTAELVQRLEKADAAGQVRLLALLARRGDKAAATAVVPRLEHAEETVRVAAVTALARLGDAGQIPTLLNLATAGGAMADAARNSLIALAAPGVDARLLALAAESETPRRLEVFRVLAARGTVEAAPVLLQAAGGAEPALRVAALQALATVARAEDYGPLLARLVAASSAEEIAAAERAVLEVGGRIDDPAARTAPAVAALEQASPAAKLPLLRVLGGLGGVSALAAVRSQFTAGDTAVRDAAVRALAGWPDVSAAADLLKIAESSDSATHRVLALRGYLRLVRELKDADAQLTMLDAIRPIATTTDAKKLLLAALGEVGDPGALHVATELLDDAAVQAEAAVATLKIARAAMSADPDAVRAAMRKLRDKITDRALVGQATTLDEEAQKTPSPAAAQEALRPNRQRSDAQKAELAKRAPQGMHLACYLDCGPDSLDGPTGGPLLRLIAGQAYMWQESLRAADGRFGSVAFDGQRVTFEAAGLNPKRTYQLGFSWWDYDHGTRVQSVLVATGKGEQETKLVDKTALPSAASGQKPAEKTVAIPADLYREGTLRIIFRNDGQPNVVVSELWLWESE